MMLLLLYYFLSTVYFSVVTVDKIFYLCISMSGLSSIQIFFSKMICYVATQIKQTNLIINFIFQQKVQKKILMILFFNILWMN